MSYKDVLQGGKSETPEITAGKTDKSDVIVEDKDVFKGGKSETPEITAGKTDKSDVIVEDEDVLQGGKSEKPVEKPENSGKMKKMKKVKKVRKTKKTLKNIQATEMNDWDTIVSIEDLKNANVRAVTSKLHSVKSNRGDIKLIHVVTGREVIARIQGPEKMSLTQLWDYLCLGNSTKINQNRQKLRKLMDLLPKSKTTIPAVTSGWSLLTEGDVEYQIQSMMQLTEFLVDKEKIKR
ncbi:uncharacterized protein [Mytilus edulis]|uniref:uncharacterized protein n=1 Tax=Mytilus edulis TaxID=6550 RepID=UPI0039EEE629